MSQERTDPDRISTGNTRRSAPHKCRNGHHRLIPLYLSLVAILTVAPTRTVAQEVYYLALQAEGTASVIIDRAAAVGFVTDAGRRGQGGMAGGRIDGRTVLDYLKDNQVQRLVLTCSHPHRDHAGGLEELVRDSRILDFDEITFVDNSYASTTGKSGLYDIFLQTVGRDVDPARARYFSARNRDAFTEISATTRSVKPGNYVYDPESIGQGPHDQSVITQYDVIDGSRRRRVVDFDDASSRLIRHWANGQPPQMANVLIVPHHGSSRNDLSPVLDNIDRHGLEDVVITVNRHNRYGHPAPGVLRSLVERLGPDHVYVTDSEMGENVRIAPGGVTYQETDAEPRVRLGSFIEAQIQRYEADYRAMLQKASAAVGERVVVRNGSSDELADGLVRAGLFGPGDASRFRRLTQALTDLAHTRDLVERTNHHRGDLLTRMAQGLVPLVLSSSSGTVSSHTAAMGISRWLDMVGDDLESAEPAASGSYRDLRAVRFGNLVQSGIPRWGGIVFGNSSFYHGLEPQSLDFVEVSPAFEETPSPGAAGAIVLRFSLEDGSTVEYAGLTPDELWSAYNFVQPILRTEHGERLPRGASGLIGISDRQEEGTIWTFAIHPAVAGGALARDAMRLDMLIAGARRVGELGALDTIPWSDLEFFTYQWSDAPARISTTDGRLLVTPAEGPESCMLRARLVAWEPPEWLDLDRGDGSIVREVTRRLLERGLAPSERSVRGVTEEIERELEAAASSSWDLNRHMVDICRHFDAAGSMDRLARVISVLNWFVEATAGPLPPLPGSLAQTAPASRVPSAWPFSDLFAEVEVEWSVDEGR